MKGCGAGTRGLGPVGAFDILPALPCLQVGGWSRWKEVHQGSRSQLLSGSEITLMRLCHLKPTHVKVWVCVSVCVRCTNCE